MMLEQACLHLKTAGPRRIDPADRNAPCVVFVDGACEEEVSIGGLLVDPLGPALFFGAVVDAVTADSWKTTEGQTQVIGQAELFPLLVARLTWAGRLRGRRVIFLLTTRVIGSP